MSDQHQQASDRWTVLGLAPPRAAWLQRVTEWSVSGVLRFDFVKCISAQEAAKRIALASGAPHFMCLLIDTSIAARHQDLIDTARFAAATVVTVGDPLQAPPDVANLDPDFGYQELVEVLRANPSRPVGGNHGANPSASRGASDPPPRINTPTARHASALHDTAIDAPAIDAPALAAPGLDAPGHLVAVLGRPGSGVSTTAIALAQGLSDMLGTESVLLADLSRYGDQALLHDSPDIVPGIQELVSEQASLATNPAANDPPQDSSPGVRHLTYRINERGYDLLLGLRRRRDWTALQRDPLGSAVDAMRHDYRAVVADLDDDLEGKSETGSPDIEARNLATRHTVIAADAVLVVGTASLTGARSMLQLIDDLQSLGVEPHRIRLLVTRLPQRNIKKEYSRAIGRLLSHGSSIADAARSPEHRHVDDAHRNGTRLPNQLSAAAMSAVADLLSTLSFNKQLHPVGQPA